ncbi:MAG: CocE/NonD family hydrolase, partial [Halobacteriales archaeon]
PMTDDPPYDPDGVRTIETTHGTPDGTGLAVTVFRPESAIDDDPVPALLQRTPYGKPSDPPEGGIAARALGRGYAVAFEDTRGRGESGGAFRPWVHEAADGAATVEWLAGQSWVDSVGMFGGSSPGQVQLFAAAEDPEGLGAIAPTFTPSDLHRSDFFQDGAMSAMTFLTWSLGEAVAGHTVDRLERRGTIDEATAESLHAAIEDALERIPDLAAHRPLVDVPEAVFGDVPLPDGLAPGDIVPHWEDWTTRPEYDEFWRSFDPELDYGRITVPGLHTTGWYELCQHGTVTNFAGLRDCSPAVQHLVIGLWAHQNQGRRVGGVDFGPDASAAAYGRGDQLLAFFETYLRGEPTEPFGEPERPLVEVFRASVPHGAGTIAGGEDDGTDDAVAGTGTWIGHDDWPPRDAEIERWYISSGGEAASDPEDGRLSREPPAKFEPSDSWVHDPEDPVPTRGGPLCCRDETREPGMFDRSDSQTRGDVATYTTPAFTDSLDLAGPVSLRLTAATSAPDADFVAVLSHVTPDGRAFNLCEGIRRVQYRHGRDRSVPARPGEPLSVEIDLWSAGYRVPAGGRLRLEVASSNHPRFDPHPGTTEPWRATEAEVRTAEATVFHERDRESVLSVHVR